MLTHTRRIAILGLAVALVAGVAIAAYFYAADGRAARKSEKAAAKGPQAVLITTAVVQPRTLDIYEEVVGTIENVIDPTVGAEVAGRVTRVAGFTGKKVKHRGQHFTLEENGQQDKASGSRLAGARLNGGIARRHFINQDAFFLHRTLADETFPETEFLLALGEAVGDERFQVQLVLAGLHDFHGLPPSAPP